MGLDFTTAKLMLWGKNLGVSFERVLTLGHQGLSIPPSKFRRAVKQSGIPATPEQVARCFEHPVMDALFADNFFRFLGANEVHSVDRSDFEGATILHDLNERFPEKWRGHFDLVYDGGTLEHIFNYPAALAHCLELLRVGGHFVAHTPASGQMGHGFYQFSPELFFRVFSEENGFELRKILLYDVGKVDPDCYEVKDPATTGLRSGLTTPRPMQLAVLAKKITDKPIFASPPQQSDYVTAWKTLQPGAPKKKSGRLWQLRVKLNPYWPFWLRRQRDLWKYRRETGRPSLSNDRHYHKVDWEEAFRERP